MMHEDTKISYELGMGWTQLAYERLNHFPLILFIDMLLYIQNNNNNNNNNNPLKMGK
jgi:hypothetical protein